MEPLPEYIEGQVPQSAFDVLLTRIAARVPRWDDARVILESFVESQKAPAYNGPDNTPEPPKPIDRYPQLAPGTPSNFSYDLLTVVKQAVVNEFFDAIVREDNESITLLIQQNIVSANTTSSTGKTPLLAAIVTQNFSTVKQILDLGADPNAFGEVSFEYQASETRTPLMLAAKIGSLPLVKLLFEPPYSANDALVAPDGQIALRLAAEHDHRAIVDYLPSRRGGSFLRFKTHNARNIARVKRALHGIYYFIKFFVWEVPKFFLWSAPKHLVVLPLVKACKWSWENRGRFGGWCKRQVTEVPKKIWAGIKKIPKVVADMGKGLWKFGTQTLPRWLKNIAIWIWELVTKRIPKAIGIALKWTWDGIKSCGVAIWGAIIKIVSLLHTMFEAIVSFFRRVTLKDIWNSFCDILSSIFITFPKTLWTWIRNFGTASYKAMKALFGWVGQLLWWIGTGLLWTVVYIPRKLWSILQSIGNSLAKAAYEVVVWINPKA